tara:strand:+ start:3415 stop:4038 length:624 start_codon:yes stop_codon:yes gene_type:complete
MTPFDRLTGIAAPLPLSNVDTDKILAGRFLKTISREGLGDALFWTLRQNPDFVLNRHPWSNAEILISLDNFGCGSSREHAPWALLDFGFRCIIAAGFADIFYNNCFKNGILPVVLPASHVDRLMLLANDAAMAEMTIDLPSQSITLSNGERIAFDIDPKRKDDLLLGVDDIARSLTYADEISAHEQRISLSEAWLDQVPPPFFSEVG